MREAARQIIQDEMRTGGDAVPWLNMERYTSLMLQQSVRDYLAHAAATRTTFFDRGVLDTITHGRVSEFRLPDSAHIEAHQYRYNRMVLMAPPWREIYETDAERKQTFEESMVVYRANTEVYREYGYDIVEIPCAPVGGTCRLYSRYDRKAWNLAGGITAVAKSHPDPDLKKRGRGYSDFSNIRGMVRGDLPRDGWGQTLHTATASRGCISPVSLPTVARSK